jgi:predicted TIM-barrel fold metal-dependent hydrolase
LSGIVRIDPTEPEKSCAKMERWIRRGPCIGIKYNGGNRGGLPCSHPNNFPIIRLAAELNAVIYIHTWLKVGTQAQSGRWGAGNLPGENTPMDVVELHRHFPEVPLICGHSGGDWEIGIQVVRPHPKIYFEFAGSDSHSGQVDMAVRELGIDRITWGGHGPSRSYATELSKVLDGELTTEQRRQILGGNYRRLAAKIFRDKGLSQASRWGVA